MSRKEETKDKGKPKARKQAVGFTRAGKPKVKLVGGMTVNRANPADVEPSDLELGVFRFNHTQDNEAMSATEDNAVMKIMGVRGTGKTLTLTQLVRRGAPLSVIKKLETAYGSSQSELSEYLSISLSTLNRRKQKGEKLTSDETDKAVRYARLYRLAVDMMKGDSDAALRWLKSPKKVFAGETPMERATTEAGASEVEQIIGRIRHGVFS
jgi:putative toxin-antitoxin system antitoxin component (TIGR02293 family)